MRKLVVAKFGFKFIFAEESVDLEKGYGVLLFISGFSLVFLEFCTVF